MEVRRIIKHSYHLLSQELAHTNRSVCRDIIVEQHPFSCHVQLWPNPPDTLHQSVQTCLMKCGINGLTCRKKFLVDDAFAVEKGEQQSFDLRFLQTTLFWSQGSRWTPCHRFLFLLRIELVAPGLISRDDVFQKQWILVTHGYEVSRKFHTFCFMLVCELVQHKSGADLPRTQIIAGDGVRRILANPQLLRNQS